MKNETLLERKYLDYQTKLTTYLNSIKELFKNTLSEVKTSKKVTQSMMELRQNLAKNANTLKKYKEDFDKELKNKEIDGEFNQEPGTFDISLVETNRKGYSEKYLTFFDDRLGQLKKDLISKFQVKTNPKAHKAIESIIDDIFEGINLINEMEENFPSTTSKSIKIK